MLRDIIVAEQIPAEASYYAAATVATGTAVLKGEGTFAVPAKETASELFFVQKARIPEGVSCALTEFSDYFEEFNTVKKDAYAVLYHYPAGSLFATSEYAATLTANDVGKRVSAGTDGKLAVSTVASPYVLDKFMTDNGHTLAQIRVSDVFATNTTVSQGSET